MEDPKRLSLSSPEPEKYSKEMDVAVRAVQMACSLCQKIQDSVISKATNQVQAKDDNSPVTVAGTHHLDFFPLCFVMGSCYFVFRVQNLNWV